MSAIAIEHVSKSFGAHRAVDDLSFDVPSGSIYGFIGPNGSGKTTTLRMIMRIIHPDEGSIRVLGEPTGSSEPAGERIGYLPEERGLYRQMRVRDCLLFFAELKGCQGSRPLVDAWLERLDLARWANEKIIALSKGMAQKVQFIVAVIARPQLVLLDEPFSGLDPVASDVLRAAVLDLRRDGTSVVFSTHDMLMAERLCDRVLMIHKGKKVLDGTLEAIEDAHGRDTVRVLFDSADVRLDDLPGVQNVSESGRWRELRLAPGADSQRILAGLMERGKIAHFELTRPSLHDIFVRIAGPAAQEPDVA